MSRPKFACSAKLMVRPFFALSKQNGVELRMQGISPVIELTGAPPAIFDPTRMINGGRARSTSTISVVGSKVHVTSATTEISATKISSFNRLEGFAQLTLEIKRDGERIAALPNIPFGIRATPAGEISLTSEQQETPWRFLVQVNFPKKEMSLSFELNYANLSVDEALEGVRFNQELSRGGEFIVSGRNPITGAYLPIASGDLPSGAFDEEDARFVEMLEQLAFIQSKTRVRFSVPDHSISFQEWSSIAAVCQILKTGRAAYEPTPWITLLSKDQASDLLRSFDVSERLLTTIQFSDQQVVIFGTRFSLGPVIFFTDKTRILREDIELLKRNIETSTPDDKIEIRFTPDEGSPIDARYFDWLSFDELAALKELLKPREPAVVSNESALSVQVRGLIELAKDEVFEDGIESEFVKGLSAFVEAHRERGLSVVMNTIERGEINAEITTEVLLWLGRLTDPSSHEERLKLLERFLQNASARLRDAASTALALMDDPKALPALKVAIECENVSDLRKDMQQVLAQLESVH